MAGFASAAPTKHFFFEMFTRDISLEDCVLDLIDNSIDSLTQARNIDVSAEVLTTVPPASPQLGSVAVTCTERELRVRDDCGGIDTEFAKTDLFSFGHPVGFRTGQLGAYGVGLKRALFKIGNKFEMWSFTNGRGFKAYLDDVRTWASNDAPETWIIPFIPFTNGRPQDSPPNLHNGTEIVIRDLHEPVKLRVRSGTLKDELYRDVAQTYSLFLGRFARVLINGDDVRPWAIPVGQSETFTPGIDEFYEGEVRVKLIAGLAARPWTSEKAGWYILCNGRVVKPADKTDLTGWVSPTVFHDKYRGFLGLAFFQSDNTLALPWTTTKRDVNRESIVFQKAVDRMREIARPVLRTLSDFYQTDELVEAAETRQIAAALRAVDVREVAIKPSTPFSAAPRKLTNPSIRIQYNVPADEVERAKKCLRRPRMSNSEVGRQTFAYFMKKECPK